MSNFNASYLSDLIKRAQNIREQQQRRESLMARQQTISSRQKQPEVIPTAIRPRQRVLGEPDTRLRQRQDEITPLLKQAEAFQVTKKPSKDVMSTFGFFGEQAKTTRQAISSPSLDVQNQIQKMNRLSEVNAELITKSRLFSNIGGFGSTRGTGGRGFSGLKQITEKEIEEAKKLSEEKEKLIKELSLRGDLGNFREKENALKAQQSRIRELGSLFQTTETGLQTLQSEFDKFYKQGGKLQISEDVLSMADIKGWSTLKAEYEKNMALRDTYYKKFLKSGQKFDKDWFETYNKAVVDTAKNMSSELPKILKTAETSLSAARATKEATVGSLQAIQKTLRPEDSIRQKERVTTKEAMSTTREQAIARAGKVAGFDTAIKKTPQFKVRPI
jgi:regulator of replication initiation timing